MKKWIEIYASKPIINLKWGLKFIHAAKVGVIWLIITTKTFLEVQILLKMASPPLQEGILGCKNLVPVQKTGGWQNLRKIKFVENFLHFEQKHENLVELLNSASC